MKKNSENLPGFSGSLAAKYISCSTEFLMINRTTVTSPFWPCLCARPIAWDSYACTSVLDPLIGSTRKKFSESFFHERKYCICEKYVPIKITWLASTRLVPDAAFSKLSKMTLTFELDALKLCSALFFLNILPSTNALSIPWFSNKSPISSRYAGNCEKIVKWHVTTKLFPNNAKEHDFVRTFEKTMARAFLFLPNRSFKYVIKCANLVPSVLIKNSFSSSGV